MRAAGGPASAGDGLGAYRHGVRVRGVSENQEQVEPKRLARITVASVLTALEGVVVAGFGIVSLVLLATRTPDGTVQAATMAVTVLALSVIPLLAARGLWLSKRWGRGPSMIVQVLSLPFGWQMAQNGGVWTLGGLVIAGVGVVVIGCLLNPPAILALRTGDEEAGGTQRG